MKRVVAVSRPSAFELHSMTPICCRCSKPNMRLP
jgi:hypothetical protein